MPPVRGRRRAKKVAGDVIMCEAEDQVKPIISEDEKRALLAPLSESQGSLPPGFVDNDHDGMG
jgi:hypothetical protein